MCVGGDGKDSSRETSASAMAASFNLYFLLYFLISQSRVYICRHPPNIANDSPTSPTSCTARIAPDTPRTRSSSRAASSARCAARPIPSVLRPAGALSVPHSSRRRGCTGRPISCFGRDRYVVSHACVARGPLLADALPGRLACCTCSACNTRSYARLSFVMNRSRNARCIMTHTVPGH